MTAAGTRPPWTAPSPALPSSALTEHAITFTHTEVDPAFEGQGVGSALARGALDDAIHRGDRRIKVVCPFIRAWVERHPDYQELLEPSHQS